MTSKTIGGFSSFVKNNNGVVVKGNEGSLRIIFFSPSVVKVSLSRDGSFDDFSYAVCVQPSAIDFTVKEDDATLRLGTSRVSLSINKTNLRLRFEDSNGNILNEDDPGLGTAWIGEQVTTYKKLQEGERFIGLGEKTGALDRRGHQYQNWTTDAYGYHGGQDPLYCSTPFYIGIHHKQMYGIYFDNSYKSFFNFGASNNRFASFSADSGAMNYFLIEGNSVGEIVGHYTWLTGRMEMPPLWSLGYQQCRYSYYPDKEVKTLARTFREKDIPADVIVLDIHYMDKYKIFTWDPKNFSDPKGLLKFLTDEGFKVVVMCDPGIKVEEGYHTYDDGKKNDVFLKYPDGEYYQGQVWPGWCHFPDFTKPATRSWWQEQLKAYTDLGIEGYWNDMNEIATWGHGLPENIEFDFDGNKATTRRGRNQFGFQMARSTYEGVKGLMNGRRPFNLTRSGFSGIQRYAAVWTGDNVSYDEHMLLGVRLVNSLGLTGVAFAGYDAGGFVGEANPKLYARWMTIAALSPFFRGHTMINTRDAEPWSFGEEVEQIVRNFIKLRYRLMPYIYSLFHEASTTGMPVQRSLTLSHPFEPRVYDHQFHNQYLFGPNILVCPVESNRDVLKIFFPEGEWYSVYTGAKYAGNQEVFLECPMHRLPVFVKAGSVLPMKTSGKNTKEYLDELVLHVYQGGGSEFTLYEDDGETFEYQKGQSSQRKLMFNSGVLTLTECVGNYKPSWKTIRIFLHGFAKVNGFTEDNTFSFFTPIEKYDPINDPEWMGSEPVQWMTIPYSDEQIVVPCTT
ncbi:MAG TPA: glycoside hydrolase family 31 protein [Cyclobacteriaceae bacterium]|nr:glycoside hydrolase family 31 protein [Cyclobacteriaceae bacterium]